MMHVKFNFDSVMKRVEKLVDNLSKIDIDSAVASALDEIGDLLLELMQSAVKRHYDKGNAYEAIKRTNVERAGNKMWVEVGAMRIRYEDQKGFHVIYQEYGSPGKFAADPWLRPALEKRSQINKIVIETFKKWGVPDAKAA